MPWLQILIADVIDYSCRLLQPIYDSLFYFCCLGNKSSASVFCSGTTHVLIYHHFFYSDCLLPNKGVAALTFTPLFWYNMIVKVQKPSMKMKILMLHQLTFALFEVYSLLHTLRPANWRWVTDIDRVIPVKGYFQCWFLSVVTLCCLFNCRKSHKDITEIWKLILIYIYWTDKVSDGCDTLL